ncbi:MAG: NUDIX hydrolase [Candidatus Vogelbacteria bacterium CG10_big_fil_rev_8_21_14_0_10_45_14]|uniref:NUDIX hydrolase n=1 Tax=Candidatus Vogelbacteria bacterium CG10_big_fil_rev_8_21_14_0_10_45_14 TaxID=1975042 RepID=A0A2H0RJQ4_9BACT|nr:MAG: NUDIX hydrolase [Candidatus Vogelbacteria bacterium CG10_big_fil_rev_8_21_14_0_10_45_14]
MNEKIPDCFYRISVKALILDSGRTKFLLVKEDNGYWALPGGGLDWGENQEECIAREIKEEMGLDVLRVAKMPTYFITFQSDLSRHQELNRGDAWRANVIYDTEVSSLDFVPSEECVAVQFFEPEEVKKLQAFHGVKIFASQFDPSKHKSLE